MLICFYAIVISSEQTCLFTEVPYEKEMVNEFAGEAYPIPYIGAFTFELLAVSLSELTGLDYILFDTTAVG